MAITIKIKKNEIENVKKILWEELEEKLKKDVEYYPILSIKFERKIPFDFLSVVLGVIATKISKRNQPRIIYAKSYIAENGGMEIEFTNLKNIIER